MCGLTGFCDFNKKLTQADLQKATDCLKHRGPDGVEPQFSKLRTQRSVLGTGVYRSLTFQNTAISQCLVMISTSPSFLMEKFITF